MEHTVEKRRGRKLIPLPERLAKHTVKDESSDCLLWTGVLSHNGYGRIGIGRTTRPAHVVAFELAGGTIPDGYQIDHLCRVRNCVNPDHLEAVTPRENTLRSPLTVASQHAAKTHCVQGHEFTPENTRQSGTGRRVCRECARLHEQARRPRPRAKEDAARRALAAAGVAVMALLGLTGCHHNVWFCPGSTASCVTR